MRVCIHGRDVTLSVPVLMSNRGFFPVYITLSKHSRAKTILESHANPPLVLALSGILLTPQVFR